jgi:hypothetical protein
MQNIRAFGGIFDATALKYRDKRIIIFLEFLANEYLNFYLTP